MKNPFKAANIMDTAINVGIGGAANVSADYAMSQVSQLASLGEDTKNYIKICVGIVGGTLVSNKYLRAAVNGIATVGVSNLVASLMGTESATDAASGLKPGTIGRLRAGSRYYRGGSRRVAGTTTDFMGC